MKLERRRVRSAPNEQNFRLRVPVVVKAAPAGVPDAAPAGVPDDAPAGVPDDAPAGVPDDAPAGVPDDVLGGVPVEVPVALLDGMRANSAGSLVRRLTNVMSANGTSSMRLT